MSTMTDAIAALKNDAALAAVIAGRVYTDLPDDLSALIPCVELRLIAGPPFQGGTGKIVATMERWRFKLWANDAQEMDATKDLIDAALVTLWSDGYDVQLLESDSDKDPRTGLFWWHRDARFIGCV